MGTKLELVKLQECRTKCDIKSRMDILTASSISKLLKLIEVYAKKITFAFL